MFSARAGMILGAALGVALATGPDAGVRGGEVAPPRAPERLSETGLFAASDAPRVDPKNRPYSPQYPLWSDGAGKSRWVYLPDGATIDASDVDAWRFPVGTKLWKEFAFGGRKVETRFLWKATASEWVYATYLWNDAQTDGVLAPAEGVPGYVAVAADKRLSIPGVTDCKACHEGSGTPVLGFTALQLSTDRDPNAPHVERLEPGMVTLKTLVDERRLRPEHEDLLERPPRVPGRTPRERAALGYLSANCGVCHNAAGPLSTLDFDLAHRSGVAAEPAISSAVGVKGRYVVPDVPPRDSRRIAPGAPERSSVLFRMQSRRSSSQMPPLGSVLVDEEALALLRAWIAEQ